MNSATKLKEIIDTCEEHELIKMFKNGYYSINAKINFNGKNIHWLNYFFLHCGEEVVNRFLDLQKINLNELKGENDVSLVWQLYSDQNDKLLKLLLKHGASSTLDEGFTLLHWVASRGDIEMLRNILLNNDISLDEKDLLNEDADRTPLHWAAQENQIEIANLLLENGANIEAKDIDGKTPLHIAVSEGNNEFANLLLRHGADEGAKDNFGLIPFEYSILYGVNQDP